MNLSQLEAFAETCRLGSYTRAAQHLFISQPALHHKVKQLEAELGTPLLVVHNRRVVPTADGRFVLAVAEQVLTQIHGLEAHFRSAFEEHLVRVGAVSLLAATILSAAVEAFKTRYPDTRIQVVSLDPENLYDALANNQIDLAVTYQEYVTSDLEIEPLRESYAVCAVAPDHPLHDGRAHKPAELLQYPIALTEKGMGQRSKMEAWFRETTGVEDLPVAFEARTGALLAQVTASSHSYITFLPEAAVPQFNLVPVLIDGPPIRSSPAICYLPFQGRRAAVEAFLKVLRHTAGVRQAEHLAAG
jgi:DNA-binding transcriptional LysR family regulator